MESGKTKQKFFRPKLELIQAADVVDVWKLYAASQKEHPSAYPEMKDESSGDMQLHLYQMLVTPGFLGIIAKTGKRPIGQIFGHVSTRPFGSPRRYLYVFNAFVDPEFRKRGLMQTMSGSLFELAKKNGITHWESNAGDQLKSLVLAKESLKAESLYTRVGGRIGA